MRRPLPNKMRKELAEIKAAVEVEDEPEAPVIVVNYGPAVGHRPRLRGAFYTGSARGFEMARQAKAAGLIKW